MRNQTSLVDDRLRPPAIWRGTRGQDFVEYALLAGLLAVASVLVWPGMSESLFRPDFRQGGDAPPTVVVNNVEGKG